ncbi:hypothetical protein DSQ79_02565 [Salmonella enterica subsp. diarizonae]|nr:hypothetical protein [Salmonella enterica subsp. diarizonae]
MPHHITVPSSNSQDTGGKEVEKIVADGSVPHQCCLMLFAREYAHLAPNHLTEHTRQIDSIFSDDVQNMSHLENKELAENR